MMSKLGLSILLKEKNWNLPYIQEYITQALESPTSILQMVPFLSTSNVLPPSDVLCSNIWDKKKDAILLQNGSR